MLEQMWANHTGVCLIAASLVILVFVALILARVLRMAVGLAVLLIVIPIFAAIFWGDGKEYVDSFARLLDESRREQIMEGYTFYRAQDAKDPAIDFSEVSEVFERLK